MTAEPTPHQLAARHLQRHDGPRAWAALLKAEEGAQTSLLRALALRWMGETTQVVEQCHAAVALSDDPARTLAQAARICFNGSAWGLKAMLRTGLLHHDLPAALELADASLAQSPSATAHLVRAEVLERLGRPRDCLDAYEAAVLLQPDDARLRLRVARQRLMRSDHEGAWDHVAAAHASAPDDLEVRRVRADVAVALAHPDAKQAVAEAQDGWVSTVRRWLALGEVDEAVAEIEARGNAAGRARLFLWRGDDDMALALAEHALTVWADDAAALLVRAAVSLRKGQPCKKDLVASLNSLRAEEQGWIEEEAVLTWMALARLGAGHHARAVQDASQAMAQSPRYHLTAHLVRLLAAMRPEAEEQPLDPGAWRHFVPKIAPLLTDPQALDRGQHRDVRHAAHEVLARFGGNRSATPTVVEDGRLVPFRVADHPRHLARALEHGLRWDGIDAVVARYTLLQAEHPEDPTPHTYCGEVLVWAGQYAEAERHFRGALTIDPTTTWAWIGLGASQMLRGDPELALSTWDEGVAASRYEGPTLFVYRGEARWRLGHLDAAQRDLDLALSKKPQRLSGWILRALLAADQGSARPAAVVDRKIRTHAPGLWLDAAHGGADPADRLRTVLELLRGNRSSTMVTWFTDGDAPRIAWWQRDWLSVDDLVGRRR